MTGEAIRKRYPTDLSDAEWLRVSQVVGSAKPVGRPPVVSLREVVNAFLYIERSNCSWRMLPHDFPPYSTVYHYARRWRRDGTWDRVRIAIGR